MANKIDKFNTCLKTLVENQTDSHLEIVTEQNSESIVTSMLNESSVTNQVEESLDMHQQANSLTAPFEIQSAVGSIDIPFGDEKLVERAHNESFLQNSNPEDGIKLEDVISDMNHQEIPFSIEEIQPMIVKSDVVTAEQPLTITHVVCSIPEIVVPHVEHI